MKHVLSLLLGLLAFTAAAQPKAPTAFDPVPTLPVKGSLAITYGTRTKAAPVDSYVLNVNVANSALFKGTITHQPYVVNTITDVPGKVTFELDLDVVNPANPAQTRNVGKLFGSAPIDKANVYHYEQGAGVKIAVLPIGAARGFESRFNGLALGKPPASSGFAKLKQDAVKLVSSKGGAIVLTRYDKMSFENHVLPAGPVQVYPEVTVSGGLLYDYGRSAWHFHGLTLIYAADGKRAVDSLTGSIRWIEAPNRKATGEGRYELDIRVNEPPPSESAVFGAVADESAFFSQDEGTASLTGTLAYKDTFRGDTVIGSAVQIDLKSNKLSRVQVVALAKLLLLSAVVPLNAE